MDMTPRELGLFIEGRVERDQEVMKSIQVGVAYGYASAKKGKMIPMEFEKQRRRKELSPQQVQNQKEYLQKRFKGGGI